MITVEKVIAKKEYICSFCGTGSAVQLITYKSDRREARVPICQVCYEELSSACAKNDAPKKSTRKKKESD